MLWKRYSVAFAFALLFLLLESCKPDAEVYMPTVTSTHVTKTNKVVSTETPVRTQVIGEVTSSSGVNNSSKYPLHTNIIATVFWVGEDPSADNGYIDNYSSAWVSNWVVSFGGVDEPDARNGYRPAGFTPKENPFYFALPYGDYTEVGIKANVNQIYWYKPFAQGQSLLKNRWIEITYNGKVAYGQWEDTGPFEDDDVNYVFGTAKPKQEVGLDVSPAIRDYLGLTVMNVVSWRFVEESAVPTGPWKEIVTRSGPSWK
jgi:hypothetical protein